MKCFDCVHKVKISGNCHISCTNPPLHQLKIGAGGDERYKIAEEAAIKNQAVVRCVWQGSGVFPLVFDGNTVFGCYNYKKREEIIEENVIKDGGDLNGLQNPPR
mgnify:CR=1 FL=1